MSLPSSKRTVRIDESSLHDALEIPSLDLHGLTKPAAIRRLTDFLESHSTIHRSSSHRANWVCVITGSGAHSTHGPVLRSEVQRLLERRRMDFVRHTPGSFLVNANSGQVLYAPEPPTDTKVIVQQQQQLLEHCGGNPSNGLDREDVTGRMVQEFMRNAKAGKVHPQTYSEPMGDADEQYPTLQQVKQEEQDMVQAQRESLEAFQKLSKEASQEQSAISTAMAISKEQIERERQEEEMAILRALEESKRLAELQLKEELELMRRVMEESKREAELERKQETAWLSEAIDESKRLAELEQQQEQETVERAIQESKRLMELEEAQLRHVLQESRAYRHTNHMSEDQLLQQVLEESKQPEYLGSEEFLIRQVLEASNQHVRGEDPRRQGLVNASSHAEPVPLQTQLSDEDLIRRIMAQSLEDR